MSDNTPYGPWSSPLGAQVWLHRFVTESLGQWYPSFSDDDALFGAIFEVHRVRWQVCYRLKKQFVDDPDGLLDFVKEHLAQKAAKKTEEQTKKAIEEKENPSPSEPVDVGELA